MGHRGTVRCIAGDDGVALMPGKTLRIASRPLNKYMEKAKQNKTNHVSLKEQAVSGGG